MAGTIGSSGRRSWVLTSLTSLALGILGNSVPAFSQCGAESYFLSSSYRTTGTFHTEGA